LVGLLSPYLFDTLRGGEEREKTILFIAAEQDRLFFALGVEEKRRSCFIDVTRQGDHLAVGRYPPIGNLHKIYLFIFSFPVACSVVTLNIFFFS
jgi:hypothetical protein